MDSRTLRNIYAWKQDLYFHLMGSEPFQPEMLTRKIRQCFAEEECLMICSGYPDYEHQYMAHQCFLSSLQVQEKEQKHQEYLRRFLRNWMRQHDLLCDRHFQIYFNAWEQKNRADEWQYWNPEYVLLTTRIGRIG